MAENLNRAKGNIYGLVVGHAPKMQPHLCPFPACPLSSAYRLPPTAYCSLFFIGISIDFLTILLFINFSKLTGRKLTTNTFKAIFFI